MSASSQFTRTHAHAHVCHEPRVMYYVQQQYSTLNNQKKLQAALCFTNSVELTVSKTGFRDLLAVSMLALLKLQ